MATFQPITDEQHDRFKRTIEDLGEQLRELCESDTIINERTSKLIEVFEGQASCFDSLRYQSVHEAGGYEDDLDRMTANPIATECSRKIPETRPSSVVPFLNGLPE